MLKRISRPLTVNNKTTYYLRNTIDGNDIYIDKTGIHNVHI